MCSGKQMAASRGISWSKCLGLWRNVASNRRFSTVAQHFTGPRSEFLEDIKPKWESVVGLEVHAQIGVDSKLFSGASTTYGAPTNTQVSYFDAAIPGTLPVLNKSCVEAAVRTALALNCTVHKISAFDRKHYFYADLPAGYQITQQFYPIATNGRLDFMVYSQEYKIHPYPCSVRLKQIQLEQDSGRSLHTAEGRSLIDLNRAGIGLMELVFEPDLKNGVEAAVLVKELHMLLTQLGTCTGEMEEGALRVDANISVNKVGEPFGVRTEVKNLNSCRYLTKAIDYEINRQIEILESGAYVINETRSYDVRENKTISMRDKEVFQDYRFMPEPNLPPVKLCDDTDYVPGEKSWGAINIDDIRRQMPVLPSEHRQRLIDSYGLPYEIADRIVKNDAAIEFFEAAASEVSDKLAAATVILVNVQHQLNRKNISFKESPVDKFRIKELVELLDNRVISDATVNDILDMLFDGDQRSPKEIVEQYNWKLVTDVKVLEEVCLKVIEKRSKMAKKYKNTRRQKFMTSLLKGVNEELHNRAAIKLTESIIIRLLSVPNSDADAKE